MHKQGFKLLLILCFALISTIALTVCHKQDKIILFNKYPITKDNLLNNSTKFEKNKRIYYIFITQKPLTTKMIRVRVLKRSSKANYEPIKIVYSNDFRMNKDEVYYYNDYLVMNSPGDYLMVIYSMNKLDSPLITADFQVK